MVKIPPWIVLRLWAVFCGAVGSWLLVFWFLVGVRGGEGCVGMVDG